MFQDKKTSRVPRERPPDAVPAISLQSVSAPPSRTTPLLRLRIPRTKLSTTLLPNRKQMRACLQQFWQEYGGQPAEVEFDFVDRATITRLHREFLDDPSETDIITFDLGVAPDNRRVAAVTICPEVASRHAVKYNVSLQQEINRLMFHGLLHLLGFNDKNARERRRMRYHERKLLRKLSSYTIR